MRGTVTGKDRMAIPTSADEIARSLNDEVVRSRVVDLLDERWRNSLTLVDAPGGYGKTRTIAQAVRSNEEDPVGVEFYVRLRATHADPERLGTVILNTLGGHDGQHLSESALVEGILDQFASMSPTKVCLIIDDAHVIASSSLAIDMVNEILRSLPTNSHVLLAGRGLPELSLARLRADDSVCDVTADDLVFTELEIDALAEQHQVDRNLLAQLAGWPALIRLAVVAGKAGPQEFLMQEIVRDLAPEVARALTVAAVAGLADQELFDRCGIDVLPGQLAELVPLVDLSPKGEIRPHDLWVEVINEIGDPSEFAPFIETAARWHSEHGRHDDAIAAAAAHAPAALARELLMEALDASDIRLHAASTGRWLELFDAVENFDANDAELRLLRGWHERLLHGPGHGDEDVTAALQLFHERGDAVGEARASVEHAFRGFLAGNVGPVLDAVGRSPRLVGEGVTFLQPLGEMTNAIIADLGGDFERALGHSQRALRPGVRREFAELALRHRSTLNFLVGDGDAVVESCRELVDLLPTTANEALLLFAKFANGDIEELVRRWDEVRYLRTGSVRDDYTFAMGSVFVDACLGIAPDMDMVREASWDRPRERMQVALCEWSAQIIAGEESAANEQLRGQIAELGLDDPLVSGEIRRYLVSGYVVDPSVRAHIDQLADDGALGPYHLDLLALGRILVALRDGQTPDWSGYQTPGDTVSSMSLPWAAELACGLVMHDEAKGLAFADFLFRITGARAQAWIRSLAAPDHPLESGANQLLRLLPAPPSMTTSIVTQPSVALERGGERSAVSRIRVRQLLLLLVLRESVTRDAAMTLLWPDKDIDKARNNLRITLSHMRDELEPDRRSGEPSYHLRQRGDTILLHRSEHLSADIWDMRNGLLAAEAAHMSGDRSARLAALMPVAELWQPPLLADLADLSDFGSEVGALQAKLHDGTVEVAEHYLSAGRYDEAEQLGRKLLVQDAYDERAYAIVIAAFLGAGRDSQARQAIDDCLAMLGELDVGPAPATRMLLRRAKYPTGHDQ